MPPNYVQRIIIVCFPGAQLLDIAGPADCFSMANTLRGPRYEVLLTSVAGGQVATSSHVSVATLPAARLRSSRRDTLIVAGGPGSEQATAAHPLTVEVARLSRRARRVASVCTGAFFLAATGQLDGRTVATHWAAADELQARFAATCVDANAIVARDDRYYTSGGVTAGIDLSLAMLREDLGQDAAESVARTLVVFPRRVGGQAPFRQPQPPGGHTRDPRLRELESWVESNLASDLSAPALAEHVGMSYRQLARVFKQTFSQTPARFVMQKRLAEARKLVASTSLGLDHIAARCGFEREETMRRAFVREVGLTPSSYRHHHGACQG